MSLRIFKYIFIALICSGSAHASAWLQPEGKGQAIATFTNYKTDAFFNSERKRVSKTSNYKKSGLDVYAEYGITPIYTIGFQPSFQWVSTVNGFGQFNEAGLADIPIFIRERIWHDDNSVLSLQQLITIPGLYDKDSPAALGYGQSDLEFRVLYGHGGKIDKHNYFFNSELAYRKRFEGPADEVRLDLTAGFEPMPGYQILAQSFNIIGMKNASTQAFVTASGPDYDLSKIQISGIAPLPYYGLSLQVGGGLDVYGRNTGAGHNLFISLWKSF